MPTGSVFNCASIYSVFASDLEVTISVLTPLGTVCTNVNVFPSVDLKIRPPPAPKLFDVVDT